VVVSLLHAHTEPLGERSSLSFFMETHKNCETFVNPFFLCSRNHKKHSFLKFWSTCVSSKKGEAVIFPHADVDYSQAQKISAL